jgi:hypothetical protein
MQWFSIPTFATLVLTSIHITTIIGTEEANHPELLVFVQCTINYKDAKQTSYLVKFVLQSGSILK